MRIRMIAALLLATTVIGPASAQQSQDRGGIPTETMSRMRQGADNNLIWNLLGLLGLLGILGMRTEHPDDSYHPSALD